MPILIGKQFLAEGRATGAVLSGLNTVEQVDHWGGDHHDGVPIFVPSHRPPGPSVAKYPLVTYVTDGIVSAMTQAKAAAGDRNVLVHGAYTAQSALEAGVLDELQIHEVPVLFGGGRRLFDVLPARIELEIIRVIDTPEAHTSATGSVTESDADVAGSTPASIPTPTAFALNRVLERARPARVCEFALPLASRVPSAQILEGQMGSVLCGV